MAYGKLRGAAFTGQDVEKNAEENRVGITRGERAKAAAEEPWLDRLPPERCAATRMNNELCTFELCHKGKHSWDV